MKTKFTFCCLLLGFLCTQNVAAAADNTASSQDDPWSILGYFSGMTKGNANASLNSGYTGSYLYSVEPAYKLPLSYSARKYINLELALNLTYQTQQQGNLYEINPMIMLRWKYFPWNNFLNTTIAIGEGVSYATSIPQVELRYITDWGPAKRFINFVALELTFALPKYPEWQLVGRLHHRSPAWGLYGAGNSSSNAVGLGVRYNF